MGPAEPPEPSCSQPGPSSGALHLALSNSAVSASAVSLLLDAQPDDAFLADKDDLLPLHIALRHGASLEVVSLLLKASPDAAGDEECGALPLHFALAAGAPEAVIAVLLDAYPEATCLGSAVTVRLHRDDQAIVAGRLPLHLAVSFGHSAATVRRLLAANVEVARVADPTTGALPLHLALSKAQTDASEMVVIDDRAMLRRCMLLCQSS